MLDIFDNLSQRHSNNDKDNYSMIEEKSENNFNPHQREFEINEEKDCAIFEEAYPQKNSHLILSRKGSGEGANIMNTSISFMYNNQHMQSPFGVVPNPSSNLEIGAILSPNPDIKIPFGRRETRASESDMIKAQTLHQNGENHMFLDKLRYSPDTQIGSSLKNESKFGVSRKRISKKGGRGKILVTEENYTEKFDYKKFIDQELSKLGNICG
jgi:hypothetical protein